MRILILLMLLASCATQRAPEIVLGPNKDVWIGRSSDEVMLHPEFAVRQMTSRKASNGSELITFKNSGGVHSSGGCYSYKGVSSCSGSSGEIVCNHLFLIKNGVVADYFRNGDCGEEQLIFRPRDNEGNPILTSDEKMQLSVQRSLASQCSVLAKALRSQSCN